MKKLLFFILLLPVLYSCNNDNNNSVAYPYQEVTVYQSSGLFDSITVFTSVNDSIYLGSFDFSGYDSITVKMQFEITTNGGATAYADFILVKDSFNFPLVQATLGGGGFYILDGSFAAIPSGNYYFRNLSTNPGTGYYKLFINYLKITKH